MNTELLEKCFEQILLKPLNWEQSHWVGSIPISLVPDSMIDKIEVGAEAACGTSACMAGTAMLLSGEYHTVIEEVSWRHTGISAPEVDGFFVRMKNVVTGKAVDAWDSHSFVDEGARLLDIPRELAAQIFNMTDLAGPQEFVDWVRAQLEAWPVYLDSSHDRYDESDEYNEEDE